MIPIRLTILLIFFLILLLLVVGNPDPVRVNFLFYSDRVELYKIIIGSAALGALAAIIYYGHVKSLRRPPGRGIRR